VDFISGILKGLVAIVGGMALVYLLATYGGAINGNLIPLFLAPIYVAMLLANAPARKGLAAAGLTGMAIIIVAGSSAISWVLLLTIPPLVGYIVGTRSFKQWDMEGETNE